MWLYNHSMGKSLTTHHCVKRDAAAQSNLGLGLMIASSSRGLTSA